MRKFYFITATDGHLNDKHSVIRADHGFKNISGGSSATDTQIQDIKTKFADYQVGPSAAIFLRRADVRDAVVKMNVQNLGGYTYSVREVGEFKRTVRPVLGYRVLVRRDKGAEWIASAYNWGGDVTVDHAAQFGDGDANKLFSTRAKARAAKVDAAAANGAKYSIETVYADA